MRIYKVGGVLVLALTVALLGCSKPKKASISGKVYVGDKVVTAGDIRFHGEDNKSAGSVIQGDGSYSIASVPIGACKITIHPALMSSGTAPPKGTPVIGDSTGGVPPNPAKCPPIPSRYQKLETTDLTFTVQPDKNSHEVKMKP